MIIGGNDYLDIEPQSFIFNSSRSRYTFNITIVNDNAFELTEFFDASLRFAGAAPPRVTLDPAQAEITILDDDGECLIIIHSPSATTLSNQLWQQIFLWLYISVLNQSLKLENMNLFIMPNRFLMSVYLWLV